MSPASNTSIITACPSYQIYFVKRCSKLENGKTTPVSTRQMPRLFFSVVMPYSPWFLSMIRLSAGPLSTLRSESESLDFVRKLRHASPIPDAGGSLRGWCCG